MHNVNTFISKCWLTGWLFFSLILCSKSQNILQSKYIILKLEKNKHQKSRVLHLMNTYFFSFRFFIEFIGVTEFTEFIEFTEYIG